MLLLGWKPNLLLSPARKFCHPELVSGSVQYSMVAINVLSTSLWDAETSSAWQSCPLLGEVGLPQKFSDFLAMTKYTRTWCEAPIVSARVPVYRQHQFSPQPKVVETVFISSFLFRFFFFDKKEEKMKDYFVIKNFFNIVFNNVLFFFLFAIKEIKKVPKE